MFHLFLSSHSEQAMSRHQELVQEATQERLARLATSHHITLIQRLAVWLSDLLIYSGLSLKRRYQAHREQLSSSGVLTGAYFGSHMEY